MSVSKRSQPVGSVRQNISVAHRVWAIQAFQWASKSAPPPAEFPGSPRDPARDAGRSPSLLQWCLLWRFSCLFAAITGKSSLLSSLLGRDFSEDYEPTVVATHRHTLTMKGGRIRFDLKIVDTAGQDEFSTIPTEASLGVHGYILVFDVTSRTSFEKLRHINDKLLEAIGADAVPRVVVANKSDLRPDS